MKMSRTVSHTAQLQPLREALALEKHQTASDGLTGYLRMLDTIAIYRANVCL